MDTKAQLLLFEAKESSKWYLKPFKKQRKLAVEKFQQAGYEFYKMKDYFNAFNAFYSAAKLLPESEAWGNVMHAMECAVVEPVHTTAMVDMFSRYLSMPYLWKRHMGFLLLCIKTNPRMAIIGLDRMSSVAKASDGWKNTWNIALAANTALQCTRDEARSKLPLQLGLLRLTSSPFK